MFCATFIFQTRSSNKKTYDKAIITGDMYVRVKPVFDGKEGTWCSTIYTKGYEDTTSPFGTKKHDPLKLKIDNYASKTKHSMKLSWDCVEGATGYRIEYNGSGDFTKNRVVYYTTNNYYNYTVGGNGMLCMYKPFFFRFNLLRYGTILFLSTINVAAGRCTYLF